MGVLIGNRKRDPSEFSSSPDFRISKKHKFSCMDQIRNRTFGSSSSTVSRISKYPESLSKFRREVHAPCRIVKFGLSQTRNSYYSEEENFGGNTMGNFLNKKLDFAKRIAIGALRYLVTGTEVIDVENEPEKPRNLEKELVSEDSSIEEVEVNEEDGREGRSMVLDRRLPNGFVGNDHDNDAKIIEERSLVTINRKAGKMLDSLALNNEVEVYKKLLESVENRSHKLRDLDYEIEFNEKKKSSLQLLRCQKKQEEKTVKEIPREPFIPLTDEEVLEVQHAFLPSNGTRILVSHKNSNIDITGQLLQCLKPSAWLNDEVINVYVELLKEREKREPQKFLKCHFFNTFFYKKLSGGDNNMYDYRAVKRWTTGRKLGYFLIDCDKIFVPVHQVMHWCLAIINKKDQKFQYLDSMKGRDLRVLDNLAKYYVEEVKDKTRKDIDVSKWEQEFLQDLPEQQNGHDCGMFMIKYADFYSRGLGLCFSQEHMPYFRLRTAKEILRLRAD